MLGLKFVCWIYLAFSIMKRVAHMDDENTALTIVENIVIVLFIIMIYFLFYS